MAFARFERPDAQFFFGRLDLFLGVVVDVLQMFGQMIRGCVDFASFGGTAVFCMLLLGLLCWSRLVIIVGFFGNQVLFLVMLSEVAFFAASKRTLGTVVLLKPNKQ
jgi:hypothetical protein